MTEPDRAREELERVQHLIEKEHADLCGLLSRVEETTDLRQLLELLRGLPELLQRHFALEEGPGGLHQIIASRAPWRTHDLETVMAEHRTLAAKASGLVADLQQHLDGPPEDLLHRTASLTHRLQRHEALETDMLCDAVYTDLGGGD